MTFTCGIIVNAKYFLADQNGIQFLISQFDVNVYKSVLEVEPIAS